MNSITVKGTATASVKPDTAEIGITLSRTSADYGESARAAAAAAESLTEAVKLAGLGAAAVKTSSYGINAVYSAVPDGKGGHMRELSGYECVQRMTVRFRLSKDRLERVINELSGCEAADFTVRFTAKNAAKARLRALADAVADAETSARAIASAAGCRLGKTISLEYGAPAVNEYSRTELLRSAPEAAHVGATFSVQPEYVENTVNVTAVYELAEG